MSNLCELCGKEAMGGTYQIRERVLSVCSACSVSSDPLDPEPSPIERLDSVVLAALDNEIGKIRAENAQVIKDNTTVVWTARKQKLIDEITTIDVQIDDISKPVEVIK